MQAMSRIRQGDRSKGVGCLHAQAALKGEAQLAGYGRQAGRESRLYLGHGNWPARLECLHEEQILGGTMITVRFPNGQAIQYNQARYASRSQWGYTDLYDKKGGTWIAQVPTATCIIEVEPACRVYNALVDSELARDVRAIKLDVKAIKKKQNSANERK